RTGAQVEEAIRHIFRYYAATGIRLVEVDQAGAQHIVDDAKLEVLVKERAGTAALFVPTFAASQIAVWQALNFRESAIGSARTYALVTIVLDCQVTVTVPNPAFVNNSHGRIVLSFAPMADQRVRQRQSGGMGICALHVHDAKTVIDQDVEELFDLFALAGHV